MKPTKPYFIEALYKCISDSGLTPLIIAKSDLLGVRVPKGHDQDGIIVLDISHDAVVDLDFSARHLSFEAIFDDRPFNVFLPMHAILAIRCAENQVGIDFGIDEEDDESGSSGSSVKKPDLRVL